MQQFLVSYYESKWGPMRMVTRGERLWSLNFGVRELGENEKLIGVKEHPVFENTASFLRGHEQGGRQPFTWPGLDMDEQGTEFQRCIWLGCCHIGWGKVVSYGELARFVMQEYGCKACPRAVGQALGANPWVILVPCHRVVTSKGTLGGYGCGRELKAQLLLHEGVEDLRNLSSMSPPCYY